MPTLWYLDAIEVDSLDYRLTRRLGPWQIDQCADVGDVI
jgi:hypothetical protein